MTRRLKVYGLAMVAVSAFGAVGVSAAQAANHHLTVTTAPAIVTTNDHVNTKFEITGGEHSVECGTTKYEGTISEKTTPELTFTPTYSECNVDGTINATIEINHCAYILTGNTDANGDGQVHIECAEGNEIAVTFSLLGSSCVINIPAQTPGGGVHFTQTKNESSGKQDVTGGVTVSGLKYSETGGGFCPATHTGEDGTFNGAGTAQAYEDKGSALTGTERTTPGNYYTEKQGAVQHLELTTTP
jgi:hypothetical protein